MSSIIILIIFIGALFLIPYFTRRRFGVLGLALAAGAMLSGLWVGDLTPIIANAGVVIVSPPLDSVVSIALILAPVLLLLSSGPTYKTSRQRFIGSLAFAVLAIALLLDPLESALVVNGIGKTVFDFFAHYKAIIITVCLVLAVLDLMTTRTPRASKEH